MSIYLSHYASPANTFGGIDIRSALENECEECDCSKENRPLVQTTGSIFTTTTAGVEYDRDFTAFFFFDADGKVTFQWDFDGAEWRAWDSDRREYREATAEEIEELTSECVGEQYTGPCTPAGALEDTADSAAGAVCLNAVEDVRAYLLKLQRRIDESAGAVFAVPVWALPALANSDYSELSEEDAAALDAWINAHSEIDATVFDCVNFDDSDRAYYVPDENEEIDSFFDSCPAFGLPAECEYCFFLYR